MVIIIERGMFVSGNEQLFNRHLNRLGVSVLHFFCFKYTYSNIQV